MSRNEYIQVGQVVPDEFATLLRSMYEQGDERLSAVLYLAVRNGWTLTALGNALGFTREGIRQRVLKVGSFRSADLPLIPLPPRKRAPLPKPPRPVLLIPPDLAEKLREMWDVARTVNGSTAADDPRRRTSEHFTAQLAALVDQGVSVYRIAKDLGVTHYAIRSRLSRHGYRPQPPSVIGTASETYKGRPPQHWGRTQCGREHHMSGPNLGWKSNGTRYCKACDRDSHRRRYAERRAARLAPPGAA